MIEYPKGNILANCICGSWPGGECLKCSLAAPDTPVAPTASAAPFQKLDLTTHAPMHYDNKTGPVAPTATVPAEQAAPEVNTIASLEAAQGTDGDLDDAAKLVEKVSCATTNGDALFAVLAYRQKIRLAALASQLSPQEPVGAPVPCAKEGQFCQCQVGSCVLERKATVEAGQAPDSARDAERLEFMMARSFWIAWGKDGERCRAFHRTEDGDDAPVLGWKSAWFECPREAIDAAIRALKSGAQEKAK